MLSPHGENREVEHRHTTLKLSCPTQLVTIRRLLYGRIHCWSAWRSPECTQETDKLKELVMFLKEFERFTDLISASGPNLCRVPACTKCICHLKLSYSSITGVPQRSGRPVWDKRMQWCTDFAVYPSYRYSGNTCTTRANVFLFFAAAAHRRQRDGCRPRPYTCLFNSLVSLSWKLGRCVKWQRLTTTGWKKSKQRLLPMKTDFYWGCENPTSYGSGHEITGREEHSCYTLLRTV